MRVAITHPYSWPEVRRGAERIVHETSRALARRGHRVTVLTAGSKPGRTLDHLITTVRFPKLSDRAGVHERIFAAMVASYLVAGRFDVVHSMMPWDAYAAIVTRRVAGHRVLFDDMAIPYASWSQVPIGWARERIARHVDVYACMSEFALDVLARDWGRTGALLPGGVRLSEFRPATARTPAPTVLFSAALDAPHKGLPLLLEAVARLDRRIPDLHVWLSGSGDPTRFLDSGPAEARRRVEILPVSGPHDQGERYAKAWVTALPSRSEPFGLVLIESLAAGTPIVVVNDATPPSLVTKETGAVAEPDDPDSLADALAAAIDLARDPATVRSCREFASRFDWDDQIAPLLEQLYEA